jgi:hypothetical protein
VDENIFARLLFNEPVPLGVIEPFDLPSRHARCLLLGESDPHKHGAAQTALVRGTIYRAASSGCQENLLRHNVIPVQSGQVVAAWCYGIMPGRGFTAV